MSPADRAGRGSGRSGSAGGRGGSAGGRGGAGAGRGRGAAGGGTGGRATGGKGAGGKGSGGKGAGGKGAAGKGAGGWSASGRTAGSRGTAARSPRSTRSAGGDRRSAEAGLGGDQVEGRRAVRELLACGNRRVRSVWMVDGTDDAEVLDDIERLAAVRGVRVRRVDRARLAAEARTEAPQGVLARAEPIAPADLDQLLGVPDAFLLALDGVTDPGNLGAVLRVAAAAGATGVIVPRHRSALLTPAAVKAAAGAVEHVPLAPVAGIPAALERASRAGVWSVGLDADGSADVFDLPVADRPVLLVLGAEGRGLARLTRDRCDLLARIPMPGALESLNVATAAAVAAFEVVRQRPGPRSA